MFESHGSYCIDCDWSSLFLRMVQYYEMYGMVVLLNPSTTIGTHGMDGNLWSRSVKPSLPSVKHVGRHQTGALNDMVESYEWYGW